MIMEESSFYIYSQMAQEIGLIPKDPNYHNPFRLEQEPDKVYIQVTSPKYIIIWSHISVSCNMRHSHWSLQRSGDARRQMAREMNSTPKRKRGPALRGNRHSEL